MTSYRTRIFEEIDARLLTLASEVERQPQGDPNKFPALHVTDGGQRPIETETGATRRELSFSVRGYVEAAFGASAHDQINDLYESVVAALMADGSNLGGLVELIEDGDLRVDVLLLGSEPRQAFEQDFTITFATARDDPSQPA
jgi:hypothetical protein